MNEPGINSFDEFLLFYVAATVLVGAVWVILEADVLLGSTATALTRRRRQQPLLAVLTVLGVVHPACAAIAFDAARVDEDTPAGDVADLERLRRRAKVTALIGVGLLGLLCAPHLPIVSEIPAVESLAASIPWEPS